jgi:hypothetical protein
VTAGETAIQIQEEKMSTAPVLNELEVKSYGMLCTLDDTGDTRLQWDPNNVEEAAKAQSRFNELKAKGYLAYSVTGKGDQGVVMKDFDPKAERIIMHSQMVGG